MQPEYIAPSRILDRVAERYLARLLARFWSYVPIGPWWNCWIWSGDHDKYGYGTFKAEKLYILAHRLAYELTKGPIPDGLEIDHLCRNPPCVNPHHLEAVTHQVNMLRGRTPMARNAAKTHCIHGHPFDKANTLYTKRGGRHCRACAADAERRFRSKPVG